MTSPSLILRVEDVHKQFRVQPSRPHTITDAVLRRLSGRRDSGAVVHALGGVTFSLESGRVLGIIGHNGAGKTTLLRLLCGLGRPTSGRIQVAGSIGSLLALGGGFHPDLTGRENLATGAILAGLTRKEMREVEDEIIAFAELEQFIDQPVRMYSSGMYMRLGFASAVCLNPDLLVIDEVLAVGDMRFQRKCVERLHQFRECGKSLVVVSHDLGQIKALCHEVVVLEDGRVAMHGDPESAVRSYDDLMRQRTAKRAAQVGAPAAATAANRIGTMEVTIEEVSFYDDRGVVTDEVTTGRPVRIELAYRSRPGIADFNVSLAVYSPLHFKCFETQVPSAVTALGAAAEMGRLSCLLPDLPLFEGVYNVAVGIYPTDWSFTYDYHWEMHTLHVKAKGMRSPYPASGVVAIDPAWSVATPTSAVPK